LIRQTDARAGSTADSSASGHRSNGWQPFTFNGVAAFAGSSLGRLMAMELIVAVAIVVSVAWFISTRWFPAVREAISRMPPKGEIQGGQAYWQGKTPVTLAAGPFVSISVDTSDSFEPGPHADFAVEIGKRALRVRSLLGYIAVAYPKEWIVALNRTELEPWWGAREQVVVVAGGVLIVATLFMAWAALAIIYLWPVRLIAFYADRDLSALGAWKLASAALMPGALLLALAMVAYGSYRINLIELIFAVAIHLVIGWIYAWFAPLWLARIPGASSRANPFRSA